MDWKERTWAYEWDAPVGRKLHARVVKSSDRLLYLFPSSCLCNFTVNKLPSTTDTNDSPVSFAHSERFAGIRRSLLIMKCEVNLSANQHGSERARRCWMRSILAFTQSAWRSTRRKHHRSSRTAEITTAGTRKARVRTAMISCSRSYTGSTL
jgi:hypothetical protein